MEFGAPQFSNSFFFQQQAEDTNSSSAADPGSTASIRKKISTDMASTSGTQYFTATSEFGDGNLQQPAMTWDPSGLRDSTNGSSEKQGEEYHSKKKKAKKKSHKGKNKESSKKREAGENSKKKKRSKSSSKQKSSSTSKKKPSSCSSLLVLDHYDSHGANAAAIFLGERETSGILRSDGMYQEKSSDADSVWEDDDDGLEHDGYSWNAPKLNMLAAAAADSTGESGGLQHQHDFALQHCGRSSRRTPQMTAATRIYAGAAPVTNTRAATTSYYEEDDGCEISMNDLQSFVDENMSVLAGEEPTPFAELTRNPRMAADPALRTNIMARKSSASSSPADEVSHQLLVNYMLAMGVDRTAADELASSFAREQQQQEEQRQPSTGRYVQPDAFTLKSKLKEAESGSSPRQFQRQQTGDQRSVASYSVTGQQSMDRSYLSENVAAVSTYPASGGGEIVEAMAVKDIESELPIVYADTTPLSFKHLVNERPVRRLICLGLLAIIGAVVGIVVYFSVLKEHSKSPFFETTVPTMSPSLAPTFISEEIREAAAALSGEDALTDSTSPQFRAVSWMSTFDQDFETGGLGGQGFQQRFALVVMYFSFQGEDWIDQEQWLTAGMHECEWSEGIYCQLDESQTRVVTGFDATRNNLQGTLPLEIGLLSSSITFRIPKNNVGGTIPDSIGSMTSLSEVDMSDNKLTGSIPTTIEGARDVILLNLSKNQLNSSIPVELYNLKYLRTLVLTTNRLSDSLDQALNNLKSLVTLDLRHNQITGTFPVTLDSIESLDIILLDHNRLTGSLPTITQALPFRHTLGLSHNLFSGNIAIDPNYDFAADPSDFRLQYVDISYNLLSGPISPIFGFLPSFRYFDLSGNSFIGTFPSNVGWGSLEFLAAGNNSLTGTIPIGYPTLTHLDFRNNLVTQGIPEDICDYPLLEFLVLSGNQLESTIPSCLAGLPSLRGLELRKCSLIGTIPTYLSRAPDLVILDLSDNSLARTIPTELGDLVTMEHLKLQGNLLTGPIPSELANMMDLKTLNLADNALSGEFPSGLNALIELESLVLHGNSELRGEIPLELCSLSTLQLLFQDIGCNIVCDCCSDTGTACEL